MVPGPASKTIWVSPTCSRIEQELRARLGTQVPEPSTVT
jgi:hypothetical protein